MSTAEIRNLTARCIDSQSTATYVAHGVSYEYRDSGVWVAKTETVIATDPMDAITYIRRRKE